MNLGIDVAGALPELRAQAESLMVDTALVERKSGTTMDPDTLELVEAWVPVYSGPCKVRKVNLQAATAAAGEVSYAVTASYVDLPLSHPDVGAVRSGDRLTVTAAPFDSANVGRVFTVQRDVPRTFDIERRLFCQEVS